MYDETHDQSNEAYLTAPRQAQSALAPVSPVVSVQYF
jgi:hypothetical protein